MNKSELVDSISSETGLSKKDAEAALVAVMSGIVKGVKSSPVQLVGFGTFKISHRAARAGINPQTKEPLKIPARDVMTFKVSKNLKY